MSKVKFLSLRKETPATGYWDHTLLRDILDQIEHNERMVVVVPGAYQADLIEEINIQINNYPKVCVIVTSDEERKFPDQLLRHPDIILYVQYDNDFPSFPIGYTPMTRLVLPDIGIVPKIQDWFFSGQVTHPAREQLYEKLLQLKNGVAIATDGFGKGLPAWEYFYNIAASKAVFCPPGPKSPDSFRLYETLEAGSVPIVLVDNFWDKLFPDAPFPKISIDDHIEDVLEKITLHQSNIVFAWWIKEKFDMKMQFIKGLEAPSFDTTVVMSASPIPSHPSTEIIDQTIRSIRTHMKAPIYVTLDGVRAEQEHMREDYEKFIRNFLWKCNFEYDNVIPIIFDDHQHQSGMLKAVMPLIKTPYMLYVEHDTPLDERPIEWKFLKEKIKVKEANVIRFHFEDKIPEPHEHLMIGTPDDGLLRTVQWSQRPHLASTAFYRNILNFFSPDAKCFIEDLIYGKLENAWLAGGIDAWKKWKVWIYHPEGGIRRSLNLDGRAGGPKYDEDQKW